MTRISANENSFVANGRKYIVQQELTVKRFEELERLQVEVQFGADVQTLYSTLAKAYDLLNKGKLADAAVCIHNALSGLSKAVDKREHPALLLCTLFLNREGEDVAAWSESDAAEKIEDWRVEGIPASDFFQLAKSLSGGFLANLLPDSLASSEESKE